MITLENGWIKQTQQGWKLKIFLVLFSVSIVLFVSMFFEIHTHVFLKMLNMFAAIAFFIISFVWLSSSIKCPQCKNSIGGYALKSRSIPLWLVEFQLLEKCPICDRKLIEK